MLANISLAVLVVVQRRAAKCAKKRDARAKLLFRLTNYKPIAFLPFWLLRKLPNILTQRARDSTLIVVIIDI